MPPHRRPTTGAHPAEGREHTFGAALDRGHDDLAGFNFGEIEQVVDELGQIFRRLADEVNLFLLLGRQLAVTARKQQARQRQDRVERGAEFVAHIGEKARVQLVRAAQMVGALVKLGIERDDAPISVMELLVEQRQLFLPRA